MSSGKCAYSHLVTSVLGEKIKLARKNKGFTLKELGKRINLTHSSLSKIENDKNDASKKTLIALAKELQDNFGESWLDEHIYASHESVPSKKEIVEDMSAREFVTLKFGGKRSTRSPKELDALVTLLDAEIARMNRGDY